MTLLPTIISKKNPKKEEQEEAVTA